MRQFLNSIPDEILESARVDGARELRILWSIVFPLAARGWRRSRSSRSSVRGTTSSGRSSSTNSDAMRTLPVGLALLARKNTDQLGPTMAGTVLTVGPMIVDLPACSSGRFIEGLTAGSVKG